MQKNPPSFFIICNRVAFPFRYLCGHKTRRTMKKITLTSVFNEFTLMGIAVLGAFYLGEYWEGVAVILFYLMGEWFQHKAVHKARSDIKALLDVRPETATVVCGDDYKVMAPDKVQPGNIIEVKAGERVPLDGVLLEDSASFNTAALTGESIPRTLHNREEVLAGMIAADKVVRIQVNKPYDQSALARILALVQDAAERKAPAELFIRRFARIYTPVVIGLAVLMVLLPYIYAQVQPAFTFVFDDWFYRSLVFLVISCPCALVVSIPLGYFGGIGAASHRGILFKGGNYLDAITKINTVVFDKTGTLTQGVFGVQAVSAAEGVSPKELLQLIASIEKFSNHPIAKAIVGYAEVQGLPLDASLKITEIAGYGLKTVTEGKEVYVGNARLLSQHGIPFPDEISTRTETTVLCAMDGKYRGYISLADSPKPDAAQAIDRLKALKMEDIQILSGDKQAIVSKLAEKIGVTHAFGDLLPEGKVAHLEQLKAKPGNRVAFVGDGINDTPVLALSDVGIAMGGLGSDAAIETADVVIQTDQPSKVAEAIKIGKLTHRIVWQNISMAFGVKLLVLLLGAGGMATLWEAIFADVGVALLAIFNAIRIQKWKE